MGFFATFRDSSVPYSAYGTGVPSLRVCRVILWLMWGGHPEFKIYSERARAVGAKLLNRLASLSAGYLGLNQRFGFGVESGLRVEGFGLRSWSTISRVRYTFATPMREPEEGLSLWSKYS